MAAFKDLCTFLKLTRAQTYLQSGNVVFRSKRTDRARLSKDIKEGIQKKIGIDVKVILRTVPELEKAIAANPFPQAAQRYPSQMLIVFLADTPAEKAKADLLQACVGPEQIHLEGQELFVHYTEGIARSKVSNALIERKLGLAGTARNWNTVTRLLELAKSLPDD
jgi:uncharacterized protein (DUF1697 family)